MSSTSKESSGGASTVTTASRDLEQRLAELQTEKDLEIKTLQLELAELKKSADSTLNPELDHPPIDLSSKIDRLQAESIGETLGDTVFGVIHDKMGVEAPSVEDLLKTIDNVYRLGKVRNAATILAKGPRPIHVKFTTFLKKSLLFAAKKDLKNSGSKIFVSECLTPTRRSLLERARDKWGPRNAWSLNERNFALFGPTYQHSPAYNPTLLDLLIVNDKKKVTHPLHLLVQQLAVQIVYSSNQHGGAAKVLVVPFVAAGWLAFLLVSSWVVHFLMSSRRRIGRPTNIVKSFSVTSSNTLSCDASIPSPYLFVRACASSPASLSLSPPLFEYIRRGFASVEVTLTETSLGLTNEARRSTRASGRADRDPLWTICRDRADTQGLYHCAQCYMITGFSPAYLLYGGELNMPWDAILSPSQPCYSEDPSYHNELKRRLAIAHAQAAVHNGDACPTVETSHPQMPVPRILIKFVLNMAVHQRGWDRPNFPSEPA
ncbi:hypothetical protein B566_EDAN014838 [Ephemera danica]|nr:hypothetical protein B566_EDAN014838 [Ephemera danica]